MQKKKIIITPQTFHNTPVLMEEMFKLSKALNFEIILCNSKIQTLDHVLASSKAQIILVGLEKIDEALLQANPQIEFTAKFGVGLDNIDLQALEKYNVGLGWTAGVNKRSVSELALSFALGHARNVFQSVSLMKNGVWKKNGGSLLSNKKFGIVGLGHIGTDLVHLLKPFGCEIIYNDIQDKKEVANKLGIKYKNYYDLLSYCDVISFHVPSTPLSKNMFNEEAIKVTNKNAFIINTSRGNIIDFNATTNAVKNNLISGYASDVFPEEPYDASIWKENNNILFTPHIGGNAHEAVLAMGQSALEHIKNYLNSTTI